MRISGADPVRNYSARVLDWRLPFAAATTVRWWGKPARPSLKFGEIRTAEQV